MATTKAMQPLPPEDEDPLAPTPLDPLAPSPSPVPTFSIGQAPTVAPVPPLSDFGSSVQQQIGQQMVQPTGVDPNDPVIKSQTDAFNLAQQREAERTRAAMAQRAAVSGTNYSGGFDAGVNRTLQHQGQNEQAFLAQLMQQELNSQRQRASQALGFGTGLLSQEQQQALQERLANLNSQLQTTGYGLQQQLGLGDLGVRREGLAQQNSQFSAGLGQQNNQFYDELAQTLGLSQAQLNQQAMLALLGGG